jgi:hypothetical protein
MPIFPPPPPPPNFRPSVRPRGNGMTADEKSTFARERHLFQNTDGTWNKQNVLQCRPDLPNGFVLKRYPDNRDGKDLVDNGSQTKVVNPSNFVENLTRTDPGYDSESKVAFNNLTTIEILEVSRSGNVSVDARNLNPNILDIVSVVNTFSPTEIIKLQTTLDTFFSPFEENLAENSFDITTIPGIAEVKIPQKNDNNLSKTQIQVLVPKKIQRDTIYI